MKYFNEVRPHQGLEGQVPSLDKKPVKILNISEIKYNKIRHLNGLFTEFQLVS